MRGSVFDKVRIIIIFILSRAESAEDDSDHDVDSDCDATRRSFYLDRPGSERKKPSNTQVSLPLSLSLILFS